MFLKAQAPIYVAPLSVRNINRSRFKTIKKSSRTRSVEIRYKHKPNVNKSFTCYQDAALPNFERKPRSISTERKRNSSLTDVKQRSTVRPRQLRSVSKLTSGHPGPNEDTSSIIDITINPRSEKVQAMMEKGNDCMSNQQYNEAIKHYNKVIHEENLYLDAIYNRAVCFMHLKQHRLAIPDLLFVEKENCFYDKQLYIGLAMCFAASNDYITAIRQLSKGLIKFPKFVEGYVTRAKLYIQQMKWDKAISDCYKAITLSPSDPTGFVGLGDALKGIGDTKSALQAYTKAITLNDTTGMALCKRAKLHIDLEDYSRALQDTELILVHAPFSAEQYFQKGDILMKLKNENDAVLSFEQAIKYDDEEQKLATMSLFNIGVIKIQQKDFYGAMFTFERVNDPKMFGKEQLALKQYAEAVLNMMKRKYKQGISLLTGLLKSRTQSIRDYIGNCYAYRGFGYAAVENHGKAVKDFNRSTKYCDPDRATIYNRLISEGVLAAGKENFKKALRLFAKAQKLFDRNVEPLFYTALLLVMQGKDLPDKTHVMKEAKQFIDEAIELKDSESELFFYRGLLNCFLDNPVDAIPDFDAAIDKAEDNLTKHFVSRGICYGVLKLYKEALQEFSIALQIDENCSDAYYYRGCSAYMLDDTNLALMDFQKLILASPDDPTVHVSAGNLLMLTGAYEDAIKAFSNANECKPTRLATYQRAKCNVLCGDIEAAHADLSLVIQIQDENQQAIFDRDTLEIHTLRAEFEITPNDPDRSKLLQQMNKNLSKLINREQKGEIFIPINLKTYRGVVYMYLHQYKKAQEDLMPVLGHPTVSESFNSLKSVEDTEEFYNAEMLYNLVVCFLLQQKYKEAIEIIEELIERCDRRDRGTFKFVRGIVLFALQREDQAKKAMEDARKSEPELVESFYEDEPVCVAPYESQMPHFGIKIQETTVLFRPVFNLPKIYPPSLSIKITDSLLKEFQIKNCACKPEAPWLNRVKGMIQFTEEMQEIDAETIPDDDEDEDGPTQEGAQEYTNDEGEEELPRMCRSAADLRAAFESSTESLEVGDKRGYRN